MNNITKRVLAKNIFYEMGIPTSMALNLVDSVFENIMEKLVEDKLVKIPSFGTFKVKEKSARMGLNLNTGEKIVIKPRLVATFSSSDQLKQAVNEEQNK